MLQADFIEALGVTQHRVAVEIGVLPRRVNEIVHGKRRMTAGTALGCGRHFGTTAQLWLDLRSHDDLEVDLDVLGQSLDSIRPLPSA